MATTPEVATEATEDAAPITTQTSELTQLFRRDKLPIPYLYSNLPLSPAVYSCSCNRVSLFLLNSVIISVLEFIVQISKASRLLEAYIFANSLVKDEFKRLYYIYEVSVTRFF